MEPADFLLDWVLIPGRRRTRRRRFTSNDPL